MAINRFHKPILAEYISQYIPIPFLELFALGKLYNEEREKAEASLTEFNKTYGKFVSPSKIDTKAYHDASIGKIAPLVQQAVANPELMKTAMFRVQLQNQINNIDYSYLAEREQSKQNMLKRQEYNYKLALEGKYDPLMHDVDFENYDTANGIFQDVSPMAHREIVDWVGDYVDELDYKFRGVDENGFVIHSITAQDTDNQLRKNWSAIQNSPRYEYWKERKRREGVPEDQIDAVLEREIITAGRQYTKSKGDRDPWWMKQRQREWDLADAATQNPGSVRNLTEILQGDASMHLIQNFTDLTPEEVQNYVNLGINSLPVDKQLLINDLKNPDKIGGKLFNGFVDIAQQKGVANGLNWVLNKMSYIIHPETADIYAKDGTTGKKTNAGLYEATDSKNFKLADEVAWDLMRSGTNGMSGANRYISVPLFDQPKVSTKFKNDWENGGVFHDFVVKADNRVVVGRNNKLYAYKYAFIPEEQFEGYTSLDMEQIGGVRVQLGEDATTFTVRLNDIGEESETTTTRIGKKNYIRVPIVSEIQQVGEYANTANAKYLKMMGLTGKTTDANVDLSNRQTTY